MPRLHVNEMIHRFGKKKHSKSALGLAYIFSPLSNTLVNINIVYQRVNELTAYFELPN